MNGMDGWMNEMNDKDGWMNEMNSRIEDIE